MCEEAVGSNDGSRVQTLNFGTQKSRTNPRARNRRFRQEPATETTEKRPAKHEDTMLLCWYISFQWQKVALGNLADSRFLLLK